MLTTEVVDGRGEVVGTEDQFFMLYEVGVDLRVVTAMEMHEVSQIIQLVTALHRAINAAEGVEYATEQLHTRAGMLGLGD